MGQGMHHKLNPALISTMLLASAALVTGCQSKEDVAAIDSTLPDAPSVTEALASTPVTEPQPKPVTSDSPAETEPPTATEQRGQLAKLSPEQVKQLLKAESTSPNLKVERQAVVVPSYIPEGFEVSNLIVSESGEDSIYTYYDIVYSNPAGACFTVRQQAFDGPTGEGFFEAEDIEGVEISNLGISVDVGYATFWRDASSKFMIVDLSGTDEHRGANYAIFSPVDDTKAGCDSGPEATEFVKIIQSLQYLDSNESSVLKVEDNVEVPCYPLCDS